MSVSIGDLQIQLTMTVKELGEVAALIEGAIDAVEGANDTAPDVYYEIVNQYESLMHELNDAVGDLFGVE